MQKHIRISAVAAAVGAAFAGAALPAAAQVTTIYGAGASAIKNAVVNLVTQEYCSAGTITYYDNGSSVPTNGKPGGSTFLVACKQQTTYFSNNSIQIGYDTQGGSWKGFAATSTAVFAAAQNSTTAVNEYPVYTVATTGCTLSAATITLVIPGSTFSPAITYQGGCATSNLTSPPQFGFTDVEAPMFLNAQANQPLQENTWFSATPKYLLSPFNEGTELSGFPTQTFGVVFGVGASPKLYSALQADQVKTGLIPSTCVVGAVSSPASTCAPVISRAQYRSIVGANGGALNGSLAALFVSVIPATTTFELARRDQGSGTQASSNAYFLNVGCASTATEGVTVPLLPSPGNSYISFNQSTGAAQGKIQSPTLDGGSGFAIGVVSVENESSWSAGAGFLKIDGIYPGNANALAGLYDYVSEENLHANANLTSGSDGYKFVNDLAGNNSTYVNESALAYGYSGSINGIVPIYSTLNPNNPYGNSGTICEGWYNGGT